MIALRFARKIPLHGLIGLLLILIFWYLNWNLNGLRTHWGFFPLWLGYCLFVDAIVFIKKGNSLLTRSHSKYVALFLISAPSWWIFELLNEHLNNWIYVGKEHFSVIEYSLFETLSFSTVIPAVSATAELASTFKWIKRFRTELTIKPTALILTSLYFSGIILLLLILKWPTIFYPFVWIALFFLIEPLNAKSGFSHLTSFTAQKNWVPLISLAVGCLICGFFWELWNYYSYPKWVYHLPYINFPKLFEMPLPGYVGYIPFSFELFALTSLVFGIMKLNLNEYLDIGQ
jgi:hypothetical protein